MDKRTLDASPNLLPLWSVRVHDPRLTAASSWHVHIRAPDEQSAAALLRARDHTVLSVAPGAADPRKRIDKPIAPGACAVCGYDLLRLPADERLNVQCPECGAVNLPVQGFESKREEIRTRMRRNRRVAWLIVVVLLLAIAFAAVI